MPVFPMSVSPLVVRQGIQQGSFLPIDLPGLVAWWDASRITGLSDGAAVSQWDDASGNGNHLTEPTASLRPLFKTSIINGQNVVRFDGTDDVLFVTPLSSGVMAQPYTVYVVAASLSGSVAANEAFYCGGNFRPYIGPHQAATDDYVVFAGTTVAKGTLDTNFHIIGGVFNGASSVFDIDGSETVVSPGTGAHDSFLLVGAAGGPTEWCDCDIAEIVLCSGALSAANRSLLRSYLNTKYAIF